MTPPECWPDRRRFLKMSAGVAAGFSSISRLAQPDDEESSTIVGPRKGYTPEIGTLTSMMGFMRWQVLASVKGLTQNDLDFLLDGKANTIGALLNHLAATETYYQLNTFEGMKWDAWPEVIKQKWDVAMELGQPARKTIKSNNLDYYLNLLNQAREKTLAELRKRDDKWLMAVDKDFPWGPTNNYCKWFHVIEHESNHNGQIKLLRSRLPGANPSE